MTTARALVRNWRDIDSYVSHESAVICNVFDHTFQDLAFL